MTDTAATTHHNEHFWTRVRAALGGLRPLRQGGVPAYGEAEIARANPARLAPGEAIEDILAHSWTLAAEHKVGLSLLVIELDRMSEYYTAYGREAVEDAVTLAMAAMRGTLTGETDNCVRLARASFAVILPDCTTQVAHQIAHAIVRAIRGLGIAHKESHAGLLTASVGVATAQPGGYYQRIFFDAGSAALKKAQRRGLGRIEAVELLPVQPSEQARAA